MKNNQPVTQREIPFPSGRYVVSKTDLKGTITYANDTFVDLSGFDREELIGKNHNVVRHPDMPPAAFQWLWETIKQGLPWCGIVKNRAKNGDHYWVKAFVVPIVENGQTVGYMSARTEPTRAEINTAEELYRRVNAGGANLEKLTRIPFFGRLSIRARLMAILGLMALPIVGGALIGVWGLKQANRGLEAAHAEHLVPAVSVALGIGGAAFALLLAIVAGFFLVRAIVTPLQQITRHVERIGQGDLTDEIDISGRHEAGRVLTALAAMQVNLKVILDQVRHAGLDIEARSREVRTQTAGVHSQSERQRDSAQAVASAAEEFSQSVKAVADSAVSVSGITESAQTEVGKAQDSMDNSMAATRRVVSAVQESGNTIAELDRAIAKIGSITQVIREIADQTNLLALNAAIEAARAGEQGRGFAVVADEVRKLAERTSASTKDISATVAEIRSVTDSAVASMERAVKEVDQGNAMIEESGAGLSRVTAVSREVAAMARHIAEAAREQVIAGEQVSNNIERIATLIDGNVAASSETETAVDELLATAEELRKTINSFRLTK
ncbi:MAG: PAS domain-containing protein [Sulfuritalea sp.]|nr:PAS domain-containing protein [Sulfuritalea sp.]